jgi:hypothetical protein
MWWPSASFRPVNKDLLEATGLAAHQIVQQYEDPTAAWIHAMLHKIEGDQNNSRYWYRRVGKRDPFPDEPKVELAGNRAVVAGGE